MIAEDWQKLKNAYERSMMIKRAQTARIIIMCAYSAMTIAFTFVVVLPICGISIRYLTNVTDPGKLLPLQTYYPYDVSKRPQYELTFFIQSIAIFFAILSYTGIDNFLGLLVFHICGQLEILRYRITHLDNFINFHDILKKNVINHIRLLRAIAVIDDTYNIILLVLFLYFGILFACYGFLIINLIEKGNNISITHLTYEVCILVNTFGHMCVYCAVGEILVAQCNKIYYATYSNKWYTMVPKDTEDILFLMTRGPKQICFTVGKVSPVTMATFCSVRYFNV
ncbi:PREDICTED: uncharacterized protein LOC108770048 [Trachymyrmex cornetzi]|uniref:uncharacterized protein LOC108770048 n=1 Tax=Trachymyrmex cornetzi TaxID=471704 RepID=UPI00084F6AAA|nr:PREDICTED: uncharacterized protein LOC108770048 [Trachymyrmex cornetzi]